MKDKLPEMLKENLSRYSDFHDMEINERGWVVAKFRPMDGSVAFRFYEASNEEIENLGKKYSLTIQEDGLDNNRTFRMVRGNNAQECLKKYFELIDYNPFLAKKEFDSIELIEKETCWTKNLQENTYTALKDNASIFITYAHGDYQRLGFKEGRNFQIDGDFIIFDETAVSEFPV